MNSLMFSHFIGLTSKAILLLMICLPLAVSAKKVPMDDSDGDGLSDQYESKIGTESFLADTDGDGLSDLLEVGKNLDKPLDTDGDKIPNALDYDDDNDGLPSILEGKSDTDNDGLADYLDPDSDNDGVTDGIEAGMLGQDKNNDFIDDAFDLESKNAVDRNGDGINDNVVLLDHDNDGIPDYLDAKYAKKHAKKSSELVAKKESEEGLDKSNKIKEKLDTDSKKIVSKSAKKEKTEAKKEEKRVVINRYTDSDNDGLLDTQEKILGTNPAKRDTDGDSVSDAIEIGLDINSPQDSDHDGIIDALDEDDDNDGILTKNEDINKDSSPINDDTDDDGVPNFLDANDDGDMKLTKEEGSTKDTDNDGILDYLDKNDGVKDVSPKLAKEKETSTEPEIVVLYEGGGEEFISGAMNDTITKDFDTSDAEKEESENMAIAETAINDAIKKAAQTAKENQIEADGKKKEEGGFIAWLTSLLPE